MKVTIEILQKLCPKTKKTVLQEYVEPLNQVAEYYELNTPERLAGFLAQVAHESGGFTATKENLNYSAKGLATTFKKYFPTEEAAKPYERQPIKIANRVYGGRMGNGDEASGDGSKYCGRGLIQLTGKNNYTRFAADLGISVDECVSYMESPAGAVSSAAWFWDQNNLNDCCDANDFVKLTKKINGGTIGIEDRLHHYHLALDLLK
jgi:putative chitinase